MKSEKNKNECAVLVPSLGMWLQAIRSVAGEDAYAKALARARALGYI